MDGMVRAGANPDVVFIGFSGEFVGSVETLPSSDSAESLLAPSGLLALLKESSSSHRAYFALLERSRAAVDSRQRFIASAG